MLLNLFRALLPRDDTFADAFAGQAAKSVEAARVYRLMIAEPDNARAHHAELSRIEREADEINRGTVRSIHRVFITPFDRSDILALTNGLDDIIDLMKSGGRRMLLYKVPVMPQMIAMADCIVAATEKLRDGVPLLADIARNADALQAMCDAVDAIESEADRALQAGLDEVFAGPGSPGHKLMVQAVFESIEAVIDRCEDVADMIQSIVIEQV
jgi:predicted phosphate transport protein (TIGR00153 family)